MLIRFPTGLAIISIGGIAFSSFTANYTTFTIASPVNCKGLSLSVETLLPFGRALGPYACIVPNFSAAVRGNFADKCCII